MGLDIMYISKVKTSDELLGLGEELYEEFTFGVADEFKERCHSFPLSNGMGTVYITPGSERDSFRAGSYSGYNQFRNILCWAIHGICQEDFWNSKYWDEEEFGALIDFSDCEGTICYSVAAELNRSFRNNRSKFKKYIEGSEADLGKEDQMYFMEKYDEWRLATDIASDEGLLIFC